MGRVTEKLDGGLVTSKDPAFLEPGQLSDIRNMVYRVGTNIGLQRARGREVFGAVTAASSQARSILGLRDAHFDNDDHYLITHASASTVSGHYFRAPVGDTGSWTLLASAIGVGTGLERAHFRNRFFLFNGVATGGEFPSTNRVIYLSSTAVGTAPTVRFHGMLPVHSTQPSATASGTFSQTVTGYYEYWTTEVYRHIQDGVENVLESTFTGEPLTIRVAETTTVPVISMPTTQNPGQITHWRVYRSAKKDTPTPLLFPAGFMMGSDISTATASVSDSAVGTTTSYFFPTSFNTAVSFGADWASATNLVSENAQFAFGTVGAAASLKRQGAYAFGFTGITGQILGIEVELKAYASVVPVPITVAIGPHRGAAGYYGELPGLLGQAIGVPLSLLPYSPAGRIGVRSGLVLSTASGTPTTITLGSSADRWVPAGRAGLTSTDFDNTFMAVMEISQPSTTVGVDYIKVRVTQNATPAGDGTIQFPTVVYTFGDISSQVGKRGPPPSASTGDLYQDSLVVNDVTNPSVVWYSFPGEPESYPGTYVMDFETAANDAVTLIRTVNERLVVILKTSCWRVNYLPSERDASFDTGMCKQVITESIGCVNSMCGAVYSPGGGTQRLAFVSHKGIFSTNGFDLENMTEALNWDIIRGGEGVYTPICLIDDPEESCLRFQFSNTDSTVYVNEFGRELQLHYDGRISGPTFMRNFHSGSGQFAELKTAWAVPRTGGDTSIYLGYGGASSPTTAAGAGSVYLVSGTTIPSQDSNARYTTRSMYLGEMGGEFTVTKLLGYCSSYAGNPIVTYATLNSITDDTAETAGESHAVTLRGGKQHRQTFQQVAEGMRIQATITSATTYVQEQIVLEGEGLGGEDAGN